MCFFKWPAKSIKQKSDLKDYGRVNDSIVEFGDVLLKGQRVIPRRLLEAGFKFRYPDIEGALRNIILD
jgi:hypothetical protein